LKVKILAMIGSFRENSHNKRIFHYYQEMAKGQAELIDGGYEDFPHYDDDVRASGPPEAVLRLAEQIRSADAVMFFSPEYNYSVPGPLKNAIDWMSKLPDQPFAGKPAAIISASPGRFGGAKMQYHLRQIGVFVDLHFMNKPEIMISEVHKKLDAEGNLIDAPTQEFLRKHLEAFLKFIQRLEG
jgi:chromate reductase, NAD(P)H dehydrogenase (quinone)